MRRADYFNVLFKLARSDEYVTNLGIEVADYFIWW